MPRLSWWFPAAFLCFILLSWLIPGRGNIHGYGEAVPFPSLSLATFTSSQFQDSLGKYLNFHLTSLEYQLFIKNTLYSALNFGQFYSAFQGQICRGKDNILFEKPYLAKSYATTINKASVDNLAKFYTSQLVILQNNLARRQVPLIVVMAPSKVDLFDYAAPWYFRARSPALRTGSAIAGPIYADYLNKAGVPFVDCYGPLNQPGIKEIAFPDHGTHWSMYGAAICLGKLSETLHKMDPRIFQLVDITEKTTSTEAAFGERDLADLLNIWPAYRKGRNIYDLAVFKKLGKPIPLLIWGDSFMEQLLANMRLAGFTSSEKATYFENRMPSQEEFKASLSKAKAFIIIGNVLKFISPYWEEDLQRLNSYFDGEPARKQAHQ